MDEKKLKGTKDYYYFESDKLNLIFKILEEISNNFSYTKIYTPSLEKTSLFSRAIGNNSEVIQKEMYSFLDKKKRSISLKPEGTASVVRACLENKLLDNNKNPQFYYIDSMFRYERPQKGRQRQFFQYGVENFGKNSAYVDVETIVFAKNILDKFKISKYELKINSIGNSESRQKFSNEILKFLKGKEKNLSNYSKEKLNKGNVIKIFDTKFDEDLKVLKEAPKIWDFLTKESKERFELIKKILESLNIKYSIDNNLVRGLDYYNDIVFEFVSTDDKNLGSKSTIIGGGRYDSLVNIIDGTKDIPAIGFAIGIERLMLAATNFFDKNINIDYDYFVTGFNSNFNLQVLEVANNLRKKNLNIITNFENKKINKKIERAIKDKAKNIIIIGEEIKDKKVIVKNLKTLSQKEIKIKDLI